MRILVMSDRYPPYIEGGYEVLCKLVADGLEKRGHEVHVLTSRHGADRAVTEGRVHRRLYSLRRLAESGAGRRKAQTLNALLGRMNYRIARTAARELKPDLAFIWRMGHVSIFPVKAISYMGVPSAHYLADFWLMDCMVNFVSEKSVFKKFARSLFFGGHGFGGLDMDNLIILSRAMKDSYVGCGFPESAFSVVHPGVLKHEILERPPDKGKCRKRWRFLAAARLVEDKGIHVAAEALGRLVNLYGRDASLDIVGSGPDAYMAGLRGIVASRRLQGRVRFFPQKPYRELCDSYRLYDALLFPSIWPEPFGLTIIEAMAKGLPVIASRVGGVPEIIEHGENGLLVPPDDPAALSRAMKELMDSPGAAEKFSRAGIITVRERFTQEEQTAAIDGCLREVVRKRGRAAGAVRATAAPRVKALNDAQEKITVVETVGSGGIFQFTHDLCEHIAKAGGDVTLVTAFGHELRCVPRSFRVRRLLLPFPRDNRLRRPAHERCFRLLKRIWNFIALTVFLLAPGRGVIHYQRFLDRFFITHLAILKSAGRRIIYTAHDVLPHSGDKALTGRFRRIYAMADRVIVLAEYSRREIARHFPELIKKVSVIPHGNFDYLVKEANTEGDRGVKEILFFGHIRDYKGLETLLGAFNVLARRRDDARLVVVGDIAEKGRTLGYYKGILEGRARERTEFVIGYAAVGEVPKYFNRADVVALPYVSASQSGVAQLAYSFGKPVVATRVGGLPEQVEDGMSGYLVQPRDEAGLADALGRLLDDPERLEGMGRYAKFLSDTKFGWRRIAELTVSEYKGAA